MDNKLFEIFSGKTEGPEIVTDRIEAALNKIREQQPDFGRDKIASFSLQGRSRKRRRVLILSFAAILILGVSVFAAEKYLGITDFWKLRGQELPENAQSDINKEVTYKETGDSMINFSVKEVLVQGNSIHVSARAEALEPGKYLLIPQDAMEEDSVYYLGKEGDMTIGQYLEKHNLEPVRIGFGVKHGGENTIFTNSMDFVLTEDDCMEIYVSAERESTESEFPEEIICMGTAYLEDAKSAADVMKTELHVTLPEESAQETDASETLQMYQE